MREERISPEKFDRLQRAIALLDAQGYGPEAVIIQACRLISIKPPTMLEGVNIVVVHPLSPATNVEGIGHE